MRVFRKKQNRLAGPRAFANGRENIIFLHFPTLSPVFSLLADSLSSDCFRKQLPVAVALQVGSACGPRKNSGLFQYRCWLCPVKRHT
jgi:hypothetical protein